MKKLVVFILLFSAVIFISSSAYAAVEIKYGSPSANSSTSTIVDVNFPCPSGDIGGVPCVQGVTKDTSFIDYIIKLYQFGIAIAGILAVAMIVAGGIFMSATGNIDKKGEGREMIMSAIYGIVILFGTYLILNTINPELVTLKTSVEQITPPPKAALGINDKNCGDPSIIPYPSGLNPKNDNTGCKFKKTITDKTITISGGDYYDIGWILGFGNGSKTIPANSVIWSYPYIKKATVASGSKPSSPESTQCLIYAYKEPPDKGLQISVQTLALNDNLVLCTISGEQEVDPATQQEQLNLICKDIDSYERASKNLVADPNVPLYGTKGVRKELSDAGIEVSSSGVCVDRCKPYCTSLDGMPRYVIDYLKKLAVTKEGRITITGGTEVGHLTHGPGEPVVDLRIDGSGENLGKLLKDDPQVSLICTPNGELEKYRKNCTTDEGNPPHFHIKIKS